MKILKKDLIDALEKTIPFTSKTVNITETVLIDGENGVISSTNLIARADVEVAMTDQVKIVELPKPEVVMAGEEFIAELNDLKKGQLEALCADYGVEADGKKSDLVNAIFLASKASAEAEAAKPAPTKTVMEKFCVDPKTLLKIVKSLEIGKDQPVELSVDEYKTTSSLFEMVASSLKVGEHFQRMAILPADEFPTMPEFTGAHVMTMTGTEVMNIVCAYKPENSKYDEPVASFKTKMFIDHENQNVVCCDGIRVHWASKQFTADKSYMLDAKSMMAVAGLSKKEKMEFEGDGEFMAVKRDNLTVYFKNDICDFPDYTGIISQEYDHTVKVKTATLSNLFNQIGIIADAGIELSFNGGICASAHNADKGTYDRENVPFSKGKVDPSVEIVLSVDFLKDAVKSMSEELTIGLTAGDKPIFITDNQTSAIIMPMRT